MLETELATGAKGSQSPAAKPGSAREPAEAALCTARPTEGYDRTSQMRGHNSVQMRCSVVRPTTGVIVSLRAATVQRIYIVNSYARGPAEEHGDSACGAFVGSCHLWGNPCGGVVIVEAVANRDFVSRLLRPHSETEVKEGRVCCGTLRGRQN